MSVLQFSEYFQIIFDNLNVNRRQTNKTKNGKFIFCNFFKFFSFILLRETTLESKVVSINRNSSVLLLHISKTFSNVELFSKTQTFLELIFATKIKTKLLKKSAVLLTSCQENCVYCIRLNT